VHRFLTAPKSPRDDTMSIPPSACSVVGLGKLGAPIAAVLAGTGVDVIGVDLDEGVVHALGAGRAPNSEPGLQAVLDRVSTLRATTDLHDVVLRSRVSFVVLPTPSDESGDFRNDLLVAALSEIGAAIASKRSYHVVAVVSTVMPGSTERELAPALERSSGRSIGDQIGLCYSPVFVALGSVVHDLTHPDLLLVGESDPAAGDAVIELVRAMCASDPGVRRMSWINAELAKLAVNAYVTTKISYANMLSEICERLPGADVDVVTEAVGDDRRIGRAYLRGATAYGGPCFPRDNVALGRAAAAVGAEATLAGATDLVNRRQAARVAAIVASRAAPDDRIAVLGLAYKAETPVTEESAGVALAAELQRVGFEVACFDPGIDPCAELGLEGIKVVSGLEECVDGAAVVAVMTPWPEFARLREVLGPGRARPVIVDCWRMFDGLDHDFDVVALGRGPA
jgi:UDPglucose 6-dehydrogenase